MKFIYFLFSIMCFQSASGQCRDVYGKKTDCPTEQDSLVVYNNALQVVQFYDNNAHYTLQESRELISKDERKQIFDMLTDARRMYFTLRRALKTLSDNPNYKDIPYKEYYQEIDEHRFYQRELENQIVNSNAPFPIYDDRIEPVILNVYVNNDSTDLYFGDLVQIPLYVPVTVKPYMLLTEDELILRNRILHIVPNIQKFDTSKRFFVKRDTTLNIKVDNQYQESITVFAYNNYGSGGIIGFMYGRKFKKLKSQEFVKYAVPQFARDILADDKLLEKLLKLKFGEYYSGLID